MAQTMKFDPKIHHRSSIRLRGYDYSQPGAYFVTIVARGHECLLGNIINSDMHLNQFGKIVQRVWADLPKHYPHVELGTFCVMPNHVHAVIMLMDPTVVGAGLRPAPTAAPTMTVRHPLSEIVRALKVFSARRINELRKTQGIPVWQRNYHERIIRNEEEHNRIHLYTQANPANWTEDDENPLRVR